MATKRYRGTCPAGHEIRGTLERLKGRADADIFTKEAGKHEYVPEYEGFTEVFWDEQHTIKRYGRPVLVCEHGEEFHENDVIWKEERR